VLATTRLRQRKGSLCGRGTNKKKIENKPKKSKPRESQSSVLQSPSEKNIFKWFKDI
jgi:hypothetical protein